MKRLLSVVLSLCLLLALIPAAAVTAHAETVAGGSCGSGVSWELSDNGVLLISGKGKMDDYDTSPFAAYKDSIAVLVVDSGVKGVGKNAFAGLDSLQLAHLGTDVTAVGDGAFAGDTALTDISLTGRYPSFGEGAFTGVTAEAYYPKNYTTWQGFDQSEGYGGSLSWNGVVPGWVEMSDGRHYLRENAGYAFNRWLRENQNWYYFNPRGVMVTGWQELECSRYYFGTDGKMVTGEQTIDGTGYIFDEFGRLTGPDTAEKELSENYYTAKWAVDGGQYLYVLTIQFTGTAAAENLGLCPGALFGKCAYYLYTKDKSEVEPDDDGSYYTVIYDDTTYYCYGGNGIELPYEYLGDRVVIHGGYISENALVLAIEDGKIVVEPGMMGDILGPGDELYPMEGENPGWPPVLPGDDLDPDWGGAPQWIWTDANTATAVFTYAGEEISVEADITFEEDPAATCETAGKTVYTATATFRGVTFTDTKEVSVPALGHDPVKTDAKAATCEAAGNSEYYTCNRCGKYFSDAAGTKEIAKDSWIIPATGHNWDQPAYTWADDNSSVTATAVCANDASHKLTETVSTTSEVTVQPAVGTAGEMVYTAVFTNPLFSTQTKTVEIAPLTPEPPERLAGPSRTATAVEISKAAFPSGSECVVLASGDGYADALAGGPLAYALDAPILLVQHSKLDQPTLDEIDRLKAKTVYILGGTGVVSDKVTDDLKAKGLTVERIAGANRFGTAVEVAKKLEQLQGKPSEVFFVYALNYPDALAGSNVAAIKGAPILYVTGNKLDELTASYMSHLGSVEKSYILGGEGIIPAAAKKAIEAYGPAERIAGSDRFATCISINNRFADVLNGDSLCLAYAMNYPDALSGSVFAAKYRAPLLLVNKGNLLSEQVTYVKAKAPKHIYVFGGTGVVPDSVLEQVKQAAK